MVFFEIDFEYEFTVSFYVFSFSIDLFHGDFFP